MGTQHTYQRTLERACLIAGNEAELARRLGVPVETVVDWLLGRRTVPTEAFLRATDIVLASTRRKIAEHRATIERMKRHRI